MPAPGKYQWNPLRWSLKGVMPDPFLEAFHVYKCLQVFSSSVLYWCRNHLYTQTRKKASVVDKEPRLQERSTLFFLNRSWYCISLVNYYLFQDSMFNYQPKYKNISTPQKWNSRSVLSAARFEVVNELRAVQQHLWLQPEFWTEIGPG